MVAAPIAPHPASRGEDVGHGYVGERETCAQEREDDDAADLRGGEWTGYGAQRLGRGHAGVVRGHDGGSSLTGVPRAAGPRTIRRPGDEVLLAAKTGVTGGS